MSETKKRRVYLPESKTKVGLEAFREAKTINEIGQEYGVHPVQVGQWRGRFVFAAICDGRKTSTGVEVVS
jgi:transposase-like protein